MSATRILIHGSCVSRDTVPFLGPGFQLVKYTARQSMISAMSPAVNLPAEPRLNSPFQARLVRDDFASSMSAMLRAPAVDVDLLLLDLVDERMGVVGLPGGGYMTRSQELLDSGLLREIPDASPVIPFGSEEHFALWRPAAERYVELLRETGLLDRTLLVEATFAATTDTGGLATSWLGEPAAAWNERYRRYHAVLTHGGLRTHVVGERAVACSTHRWGPAAYHYADDAYRAIAQAVRDACSRLAAQRPDLAWVDANARTDQEP